MEKIANPGALKSYFNRDYVAWLGQSLRQAQPSFDQTGFERAAAEGLEALELKAKTEHIATAMGRFLPSAFPEALEIVQRSMGDPGPEPDEESMGGFQFWPHVTFLSAFGLSEPQAALRAMRVFTQHYSCEFCIRPFLIHHPELALEHVRQWAVDPDWRVRRLASEGTRPRLPWGEQIRSFVADPVPVLQVLEGMHDDPRLIIRRSVANNLNDIAKDHPTQAVAAAAAWFETGAAGSQWTVKHGLRTLIKQGDSRAMAILGFAGGEGVEVSQLRLAPEAPHIGGTAELSLALHNAEKVPVKLVIDYALRRTLANGKQGEKVFKLRTAALQPGERLEIATTLAFRQLSTRTYYPGCHAIRVLINGRVAAEQPFVLHASQG